MSGPQTPLAIVDAADDQSPYVEQIRTWLREFNQHANAQYWARRDLPEHAPQKLLLLAYDGGNLVGGLCGQTQFSWLQIDILAVDPARRRRGIGSALVTAAEARAAACGCRYVVLDTMSFQAPDFYQRLGYSIAGELPDWDSHGHAKFFLIKQLTS